MANETAQPALGVFTPWRSDNNNGKNQRMAGDMLREFTQKSETNKKEYDRDYRDQQQNKNKTTVNVTSSTPVSVNNTPAPESNTNAVLPKSMQQEMIAQGGKINDDETYVHGSTFESLWNKRNSEEYKKGKAEKDAKIWANAGVSNREDYYKSDAFASARARAVAEANARKPNTDRGF